MVTGRQKLLDHWDLGFYSRVAWQTAMTGRCDQQGWRVWLHGSACPGQGRMLRSRGRTGWPLGLALAALLGLGWAGRLGAAAVAIDWPPPPNLLPPPRPSRNRSRRGWAASCGWRCPSWARRPSGPACRFAAWSARPNSKGSGGADSGVPCSEPTRPRPPAPASFGSAMSWPRC